MSYQVLARKWRPQTFADVVGQEHVLTALANGLSLGRIHHAYLFSGTRGVGKTSIFDFGTRGSVDLYQIDKAPLLDFTAVIAHTARRCGNAGFAI